MSTRNQLTGTVTEVNLGSVMATVKVKLDGGEQLVTASVTKEAAEDLGLSVGAAVDRARQVHRSHARRRITTPM